MTKHPPVRAICWHARRILAAAVVAVCAAAPLPALSAPQTGVRAPVSATTLQTLLAGAVSRAETPAPPGGAEVLVFGDSVTAGASFDLFSDSRGCLHSVSGWPRVLQRTAGLGDGRLLDASCWGGSVADGPGTSLADQVRYAERLGGVGPNTRDIYIQLGHNDYWSVPGTDTFRTVVSCFAGSSCQPGTTGVTDPADVTAAAYTARMKPVTDYLRWYAPGARIHLVGYPKITGPAGTGACMRILGLPWHKPGAGVIDSFYTRLQKAQAAAAAGMDLDFIDLWPATGSHAACTADPWIAGILDPVPGTGTVVWHPTTAGNTAIASLVRPSLSRAQ